MKKPRSNPLLLLAVTVPVSMSFFEGQIEYLQQQGFRIAVVCSPGWKPAEGVEYYPVAMEREIAPFSDFISLMRLIILFWRLRPDVVNAGTPKAGLLASIAAWINRVPQRIYTCHGLRLETLQGWKGTILQCTEKITNWCANKVICVSESLRQKVVERKLAAPDKAIVVGAGSCNGVDLERFRLGQPGSAEKEFLVHVPDDALIIGFVGRFTRDKGIYELMQAFQRIKEKHEKAYLLLVGDFEEGDPVAPELRMKILQDPQVITTGFVSDVRPYYHHMKMLVLPTYREGFPTVLLEAAAAGIPVVATVATGCVDAVVPEKTGILVPIGDWEKLAEGMNTLLEQPARMTAMGAAARERVEKNFAREIVWGNYGKLYKTLTKDIG